MKLDDKIIALFTYLALLLLLGIGDSFCQAQGKENESSLPPFSGSGGPDIEIVKMELDSSFNYK